MATRGLPDTSIFIASESRRRLRTEDVPDEIAVCVVTMAELRAGVLAATDDVIRARRLRTLESALRLDPLPVDAAAATRWAEMRVALAAVRRRVPINDLWIASVALANKLPVVTHDDDFDPLADLCDLQVIKA